MKPQLIGSLLLAILLGARVGSAEAGQKSRVVVDRAVVRFSAPEIGGPARPRFIFQRFLAFEARLEALRDRSWQPRPDHPYQDRHIRAALERHVGEVLLASLRIDPEPTVAELTQQTAAARMTTLQQVGGELALRKAAKAEGVAARELLGLFRRRARASLYLDRMVAPMLAVSERELRTVHSTAPAALSSLPFENVRPELERWHTGHRLAEAVEEYFRAARMRLRLTILPGHQAAAEPK